MMELPQKYEEIKIAGKSACTYLKMIISFRKGHRGFECVCYPSTGSGCIKDGICPIHARMIKRSDILFSHPSLLKQFEQLEIDEYKADNCNHCPSNKFCQQKEDDIRSCKIDDMIRRADEEEERAQTLKLQEEMEQLAKAEKELLEIKESERLQRQREADESDACIKHCEDMRNLGDPDYQDNTDEEREKIAQELVKEKLQKSIDESDAHERYCAERKATGDTAYKDC